MTAIPNHRPSRRAEPPSGGASVGIVKWFSPAKGYGFIEKSRSEKPAGVEKPPCIDAAPARRPLCGETDREIFVHHSNVATHKPLSPGDRVRFEKADGPKGPFARRVVPL